MDDEHIIALHIALKAHKGQKRWSGEDYIHHPISVAFKAAYSLAAPVTDSLDIKIEYIKSLENLSPQTSSSIIVGLLHDVLEDSSFTEKDLTVSGISNKNIWSVILLTKLKNEPYFSYLDRLIKSQNLIAINIKVSDIISNLENLRNYPNKKDRAEKYFLALHILKTNCRDLIFEPVMKGLNNLFDITTNIGIFGS